METLGPFILFLFLSRHWYWFKMLGVIEALNNIEVLFQYRTHHHQNIHCLPPSSIRFLPTFFSSLPLVASVLQQSSWVLNCFGFIWPFVLFLCGPHYKWGPLIHKGTSFHHHWRDMAMRMWCERVGKRTGVRFGSGLPVRLTPWVMASSPHTGLRVEVLHA